jgi:hypothetical protein
MLVRLDQFDEFSLFRSVVVVGFQSIYHLKMYQNDVFFIFLKIIFDISASK